MTTNNTFSNQNREENNTFSNLTEQWKKGELLFGEYWCKVVGSPYVEQVMSDCMTDEDIVEILDKVPSYGEWKAFNNGYEATIDANLKQATWMMKMEEEIQKLKELLEDCKRVITEDIVFNHKGDMSDSYAEILSRIDEALK